MRDLIVFGVVVLTLPLAFRRPFIGLLVFSWLAYMRPQDLCWGFARTMRLSFFVAVTMIAGWFANENGRRPFMRRDTRTILMIVLVFTTTLSITKAEVWDEFATTGYIEFLKIIAIALFTTGQVDSKERLRWLVWTIALCLGFYGFKAGLFGLLTGGVEIQRGPGGMLEDNNDFALALVMNIPILFYLGRTEKHTLVRRFTEVTLLLTVVTVVLTHSRGGFLAMVLTGLLIAWRSGKLFKAILALAVCVVLFFAFAPQSVFDRLATIRQGTEEASANARLIAWNVALRMIDDNPILGVGYRNFRQRYYDYSEGIVGEEHVNHVAHNSYLQIWAEGGTLSFVVYLLLLFSVYFACRRVRRIVRGRGDLLWADNYARMMEATTAGFMLGAFFLNRGHFDLLYHWVALVTALVLVSRAEALRVPRAVGAERDPPLREVRIRWRPAVIGPSALPRWGRSP